MRILRHRENQWLISFFCFAKQEKKSIHELILFYVQQVNKSFLFTLQTWNVVIV